MALRDLTDLIGLIADHVRSHGDIKVFDQYSAAIAKARTTKKAADIAAVQKLQRQLENTFTHRPTSATTKALTTVMVRVTED